MLRYYKLFDILNRRNMKKSDLRAILSPKTVAKLSKGENISGDAINKICKFLECQPGDIMEYVEYHELINPNTGEKSDYVLKRMPFDEDEPMEDIVDKADIEYYSE